MHAFLRAAMLTVDCLASWDSLAAANDASAVETAFHVDSSSGYWPSAWLRGSAPLLLGLKILVERVQLVPPAATDAGRMI